MVSTAQDSLIGVGGTPVARATASTRSKGSLGDPEIEAAARGVPRRRRPAERGPRLVGVPSAPRRGAGSCGRCASRATGRGRREHDRDHARGERRSRRGRTEPRTTLADFLREQLGLTGTHLGCEHGVCGACTVLLDGRSVRSCLVLAVQAAGRSFAHRRGPRGPDGPHPLQEAFSELHGLQCGFCTPGILMTAVELLAERPAPTSRRSARR